MKDYVNSAALQEYTTKLVAKLKTLFPGTPTAAATVADMTDHSKTYVYVGSETGYTAGDWYYWNGTAWTSGGPFQATSLITDTTLAVAGEAADAKATGDAIAAAKTAVLNAMAPAYSTSATYAVGDYVNYNGSIYRCTTAITTAESWTSGHWTAVVLGADLASQVSDLKTQINVITGVPALQFTPGYYVKIVGKGTEANLTPIANANSAYIIDNCVKGDTYTVFIKHTVNSGSIFMFLDTNNICVTATIASYDLSGFVVKAPANGKFIINADVTNPHNVYKNAVDLKGVIDKNYSDIRSIISDNANITQLVPTETETNKVYSTQNPEGVTLSGYKTLKFSVNANEYLHIITTVPSADKYKTVLYYDSNNNLVGYEEPDRNESIQDIYVVVPFSATKMYLSTSSATVTVEKYTHSKNSKKVTYKDGLLEITTNDFIMSMCKRGNNNLWDFWKIFKADGTLIWQYSSDLMGPYVVQALENADGDDQRATYTGGNHAYDYPNGTSGTPTAITNDIVIFADGKEVTDGDNIAWTNEISVTWTNDVQAWNTKKADGTGRAVLRENPTWTFKPDGTIIVQNYIRALEDIKITLYYGLQAQAGWMNKGIFIPSASRSPVAMSRFIDDDLGVSFEGAEMTGADTKLVLKIGYNPNIDLGTGAGMGEANKTLRLHANTSKLYTVMISTTDFTLDENEIATFEGYYKFINPETVLLSDFLS